MEGALLFIGICMLVIIVPLAVWDNAKKKENIFTTSKGSYLVDATLERYYNLGVSDGALDKKHSSYHGCGSGTEDAFKSRWASNEGIPNNDKAKEVYNRSLQEYIKGYDDGYKF